MDLVSRALAEGKLKKKPCAICGRKKVAAHHYDYNRPLDVIWLCGPHHTRLHRCPEKMFQNLDSPQRTRILRVLGKV